MNLSELIKPELILLNLPCRTHEEMVDRLMSELYRSGYKMPMEKDAVIKAITNRETMRGTLLPTGMSIPHAKLDGFDDSVIIIGVPDKPITPKHGDIYIRMMVLMLTPQSASPQYVNTLFAFSKISQGKLFSKLCDAANSESFLKIIKDSGIIISSELTVASVMNTTPKTLLPTSTVKEAMDMFYQDHLGYLPILDDKYLFVGELTMTDLFSICIPAYALKMQNLKFLTNFEPLEDLLRNENNIHVGDVMKKVTVTLDESSPVVEAVLKFVQYRRRYLPVIRKNTHLVGVVGYMDILKKVLRA